MKAVLITDQHFGARNNSLSILEHQRKFYEETFFPFLNATGITTVITLGDFFDHRKYTNNYIIYQSKKIFFDELKRRNIQTYMIVGNHDCSFKNSLFPNTPDILLAEYDNVTVISHPQTVDINGFEIAMIPWICQENYDDSYDVIKNSTADMLFGHLEIDGFLMYRGAESHGGLSSKLFDRYDKVFSGHYHHRSSKGNITYLGTPYEITWQDYGDPKGFHVFDLASRELTFIQNPNTLFVKLHYDDLNQDPIDLSPLNLQNCYVKLIVLNKTDFYKYDQFLNKLSSKGAIEVKVIEDIGDFTNGEITEGVSLEDPHTVLNHYIDSVDTDVDKSEIKKYIQSLYREAVNQEL